MTKRIYGHTESGTPIDDDLMEALADEAEAGYDVDAIISRRGKRGRPTLGSAASTVESVRLDPELKERLARRADDHETYLAMRPERHLGGRWQRPEDEWLG